LLNAEYSWTHIAAQHFVALHGHLNAFREASQGWSSNAKDGVCLRDFSHTVRDSCKCALSDAQLEILLLLHQPDPGSKVRTHTYHRLRRMYESHQPITHIHHALVLSTGPVL
jgi:hypothetical protein